MPQSSYPLMLADAFAASAAPKLSRGEWASRGAVLQIFREPVAERSSLLEGLTETEWQPLLRWLDLSGLALYFFDRMVELRLSHWLPASVMVRLQQNLTDNTERTRGMIAESVALQREFQRAEIRYAVLKGVSFWPCAIPKVELRSQFDLDFMVAERYASEARRILERRGYRLYAVSGRSWEFKLNEVPGLSLRDLYRPLPSHVVELHLEPEAAECSSLLGRVEFRELYGAQMAVLAPVDLFLGQALHVFKHLCGEFSRASHLLEFRRHVITRRDDDVFWNSVRALAGHDKQTWLGLGVVTLLATRVMGDFAPEALTGWTVTRLPASVKLWVEVYGGRAILGSFPGTKLYLLLQREMEVAGVAAKRSPMKALLPARLPPAVIRGFPNEVMSVRVSRYRMQIQFVLQRLRFHLVEGFRYVWESYRWKRLIRRLGCR